MAQTLRSARNIGICHTTKRDLLLKRMAIGMTKARTFANVWDALEDSPEDAATMTMRSNVMIAIKDQVSSWKTTQAQAARRLGITQPRLNDLLHGKINKFSLDTLMTLATRAGLKVKIEVRSAA
jgi:predicted XRE-type DNA-binding protein